MAHNLRKYHPLLKIINNSLVDLPTPSNISAWWNFRSLLGICLLTQILTGLFSAAHYTADTTPAFSSGAHTCRNVQYGWLIPNLHANGASFFFICIYLNYLLIRPPYTVRIAPRDNPWTTSSTTNSVNNNPHPPPKTSPPPVSKTQPPH